MLEPRFAQLDPADMFGHIYRFPEQMEGAMRIGRDIHPTKDYSSAEAIVFSGMGGSAIGGDIVTVLTRRLAKLPVLVNRNYFLPNWVNETTLVFCLSYSGSTEETLSCLDDAVQRGCLVAGITSGGELMNRLLDHGSSIVQIPSGYPPRASLGYLSIPALYFLRRTNLISAEIESLLPGAVEHLKRWRDVFSKADRQNPAYQMASQVYDSIPIIYGEANGTVAVARRWRSQLEENGKIIAFHHALPEMDHNEIVGFENNEELLKQVGIIWLEDGDDHARTQKRRALTQEIIADQTRYQLEVESDGETVLERIFHLIHLGDWVSFWVAMLHGTDPTPVEKIERLKSAMLVEEF